MTTEINFGSWTVAQSPLVIEYSLIVIEEIRTAVAEAYQKFSRGGMETGGVLYGTRDGNSIRILAMREITCEHALGPSFTLSPNDHLKFARQREVDAQDTRLAGLIEVGWFLSHTRTEILLTDADRETYNRFFPEAWQVTLVVRPIRGINMRAGFFVREADGSVRTEKSYAEFSFPDRFPGLLDLPMRDPKNAPVEPQVAPRPPEPSAAVETPIAPVKSPRIELPELSGYAPANLSTAGEFNPPLVARIPSLGAYSDPYIEPAPLPKSKRRRLWLAAGVLAGAGIAATIGVGMGRGTFALGSVTEPLSLAVSEQSGQLQIRWNRASNTVARATRGILTIRDGGEPRTIALKPQDLTMGSFTYVRHSGDVEIRLRTEDANGLGAEEASRFLGGDPANADLDESDATRLERDALLDEANRLRVENAQLTARIQQLQRTVVILQTRLGISPEQ